MNISYVDKMLQFLPGDLDATSPSSIDSAIVTKLMGKQATMCVGAIGHVAHGKSTLVGAISGVRPVKYKKEAALNISIHLGYANAKIFLCPNCPKPQAFQSFGSSQESACCSKCGASMNFQRHVSFVDCPGHDVLMSTMLNGASIMDAALLLVAANETFPQSQATEHLSAIDILGLKHVLVIQNKIDLVKQVPAEEQYNSIRHHIQQLYRYEECPVIPCCAQLGINLDAVLEYLCHIPVPAPSLRCPVRMKIIRSFDVNKTGDSIADLKGGVVGGCIEHGVLLCGQQVELRPGLTVTSMQGSSEKPRSAFVCTPYLTPVVSLYSEANSLTAAISGGLVAVGTKLDPSLTRQNKLVGQIVGDPGSLPNIAFQLDVKYFLLPYMVGTASPGNTHGVRISRLVKGEHLQLNIGSMTVAALMIDIKGLLCRMDLLAPTCCNTGDRITLSRNVNSSWRLIGWGEITRCAFL